MPGDLDGERIRDRPSSALFILDPSGMGEGHRNSSAIDQELNIDGVGVTRRDGNDQRLIDAVNRLPGPAIDGSEVSKHGYENYSGGYGAGANMGFFGISYTPLPSTLPSRNSPYDQKRLCPRCDLLGERGVRRFMR
jgi:hypothetical protein